MAETERIGQLELTIIVLSFVFAFALCLIVVLPIEANINDLPMWAVGFIEEPAKIAGVYVLAIFFTAAFLSKKKCAIYGVAAGLGFAVMENIGYEYIKIPLTSKTLAAEQVAYLMRAAVATPSHIIWTAIAALGIVYVVVDRSQWWKTLIFLLIAIALHGAYDALPDYLAQNGYIVDTNGVIATFGGVMLLSLFIFYIIYMLMPETGVSGAQVAVLIAPPNNEILVRDKKIFGRDDFAPYVAVTEAGQISRRQFRIGQTGSAFYIEDLASRGGTRLNGMRLPPNKKVDLRQGSKITLPNETTLLFTTKGSLAAASPVTTLRAPASASATRQMAPNSSQTPSKSPVAATTPLRAKLVGPGNAEVYVAGSKEFGREDFRKIVSEDKLPFISRRHFTIQVAGDAYSIEDLHSNNGTMVNGERLQLGERRTLKQGDTISCGNVLQLVFQPPVGGTTQAGPLPSAGPRPSARPKDRTAHFENVLKKMEYDIKQPLSHSVNQVGNDVYTGTVAQGMMNASVIIETCDNINDTQQRAEYYRDDFIARGYVKDDEQADFWSGRSRSGRAWIHVDTTALHVIAFNN